MNEYDERRTRGLRILARRNALTEEEWFNLLEARRAFLEPHLRDMTLKSLGELKIVGDDLNKCPDGRPLRKGGMEEKFTRSGFPMNWVEWEPDVEGDFSLNTRGIFPDDEVYYHGHFHWEHIFGPNGEVPAKGLITWFWGLTRNNQWILVEYPIKYLMVTYPQVPGTLIKEHTERRARVEKVIVRESTPSEICQICEVTPEWIWQRLGNVVREWVEHRLKVLSDAERLLKVIEQEEEMKCLLPR